MHNAHELFADIAGRTAVELENVFIHIALEMLGAESALESTEHQPFDQRGDPVNTRQDAVFINCFGCDDLAMGIAFRSEIVSFPAISAQMAARDHVHVYKLF